MLDRLFKTTLIFSSSQVLSRFLSFGYSLVVARYLGVELFGKYSYAYSLIFLLIVVVDFGLSTLVVREIVQNKSKVNLYLFHSFIIRILLAGILYAFLSYHAAAISAVDIEKGRLLLILGGFLFVRAFFDTTITYFQAHERQDINGYLYLANNFVLILSGVGFVFFQKNLFYIATAPIIAGIIASILSIAIISSKTSLKFHFSFNFLKTLFIKTIPFGFTFFASAAYARMNILILSWLTSDLEVGEYGASLRLVEGFLIIPIVGARMLYPVLARFSEDHDYFQMIVEKSLKLLILSALFIVTFSVISSKFIIVSLYSSSYTNSSDIFQILVITLISAYPNYILGSSLFSLNRQKLALRVVVFALLLNLVLNIVLIPIIGGEGAAIAALLSGISIMVGYIWFLRDKINTLKIMSIIFRAFMISLFLITIGLIAKETYSLIIILPLIAISYIVLSYIFKLIKRNEIKRVRDLFSNILNKT